MRKLTNNVAVRGARYQFSLASVFVVGMKITLVLSYPLSTL